MYLSENDIERISVNEEFSSLSELNSRKSDSLNVEVDIGLSDFEDYFDDNDVLKDNYEFGSDIVERAVRSVKDTEGIIINSNSTHVEISIDTDRNSNYSDKIKKIIDEINKSIKNVINEDLGVNLEKFLKRKQDEKQEEMLIDYENAIREIFHKNLANEINDSFERNNVINSTAMLKHFDLRERELEFEDNSFTKLKIQRKRSGSEEFAANAKLYDEIESSKYIDKIKFLQKNNASFVRLYASTETKNLVQKLATEATQEFYNNPRYKEPNNDNLFKFVGRVNDGAGNDLDILQNRTTKEFMFMMKDNEYVSQNFVREYNPILNLEANKLIQSLENKKSNQKKNKP